jgi:hypothetical protein
MSAAIELSDASKSVEYSGSPAEIEAQCEALAAQDKKAEGYKRVAIAGMVIGLVVAFFSFMIQVLALTAVAVGIAIVSAVFYFAVSSDDIEDRKLEIGRTLLRTLQTELKQGRPATLLLDFRGYDNAMADEAWLTLRAVLHDGTGIQLAVSTHHKRKTRAKRKYTKIKDKIWERVTLQLRPPKGKQFDPAAAGRLQQTRVPMLELRGTKVTPKAASFVYETKRMVRVRNRYGWQNQGLHSLVDEKVSLGVLIASYRALASAGRGATAG